MEWPRTRRKQSAATPDLHDSKSTGHICYSRATNVRCIAAATQKRRRAGNREGCRPEKNNRPQSQRSLAERGTGQGKGWGNPITG